VPTLARMALSFSRPDVTSPASVAEATFSTVRRGADPSEVRELLRSVAAELGRLQERERLLERELRTAREAHDVSPELDDDTITRLLGEETMRVLQTARESASQIKIKAEEGAARILRDATDEANRLREEAEVEAARRRNDAASDVEAELSLAKQQGREMVNEARAYRERVLSELAKRREAARQQLEQLVQGRDRLLQAFERARLVAVDVVSELMPLGEPDEYVNLAPTTGPVPMMVPARPEPSARAVESVATVDDTQPVEIVEGGASGDTETVDDGPAVSPDVVDGGAVEDGVAEETPEQADADGTAQDTADDAVVGAEAEPVAADSTNVVELFARLRADAGAVETVETIEAVEAADVPDVVDEPAVAAASAGDAADDERDGDSVFDRRDAALVPLIVAAARKLKRVLADEQNGVLDTLRRKEPVQELSSIVPPLDEHVGRYHDAIAPELGAAAAAGAESIAADTRPADLTTVRTSLRDELVLPLRDRLDRCVVDGAGDNEEITRRVRAVYREWKTQHIDDQLDDVLRLAYGAGAFQAIERGTPVCWLVDPHGPACPDAEDNALAGEVPAGEPFPTGHVSAPAHAGCRCVLAPTRQ
jgi:cell division septum initiation protein DivIVA